MTNRAAGLLGATVRIGDSHAVRVTGALADTSGRVVLLRVEGESDDVAYIPQAALYRAGDGVMQTHGHHVLLRRAEVAFYEDHGLEWVMQGDVSTRPARGIVEA